MCQGQALEGSHRVDFDWRSRERRARPLASFALTTRDSQCRESMSQAVLVRAKRTAACAVGLIAVLSVPVPMRAADPPVTFSKDIAPLVFAKCGGCHHVGGPAPFSVLSYAALRPFATQMAVATRRRIMPPWRAESDVGGGFQGQAPLTDAEVDLIQRWVSDGAPEGDQRSLPTIPQWSDGWRLGVPDLVVRPAEYTLPAEGTDIFRIFVIPLPVDGPRFVRGLEFLPGNPTVVHHANIRIDPTSTSRGFDAADPKPGYDGLIARSAGYPDGHFLGWTPGQVAPLLPKGLAWRLPPGSDLVIELHMQPSGKPEQVQPTIGLYFGNDPPEQTPAMLRLGRQGIDIPPGERHYTTIDSFVLPVDVDVLAVQPHAHYRARDITGVATLPDGRVKSLIHIADWDFRWQHIYRYQTPLALPKGTTLSMRYVYDNSSDNPRNPDRIPRRVHWGQRSADEMGDLWIQMLPHTNRDLQTLNEQIGPKVMAEDVIGYERWIQSDPNTALHDDVAILYMQLHRPSDAIRHFGIVTAARPTDASAHFNLGTALTMAGELPAAVAQYRTALDLRPDYAQAHNNLAGVLLATGQVDDAVPHLAEAVRLDPTNAQALYNSGVAMREQRRVADAIMFFRRTLAQNPDMPAALVDLAWLLASANDEHLRDAAMAVRIGERAVALTGSRNAAALDALAAAHAAGGDFARAVALEDAALALLPPDAAELAARRARTSAERPTGCRTINRDAPNRYTATGNPAWTFISSTAPTNSSVTTTPCHRRAIVMVERWEPCGACSHPFSAS